MLFCIPRFTYSLNKEILQAFAVCHSNLVFIKNKISLLSRRSAQGAKILDLWNAVCQRQRAAHKYSGSPSTELHSQCLHFPDLCLSVVISQEWVRMEEGHSCHCTEDLSFLLFCLWRVQQWPWGPRAWQSCKVKDRVKPTLCLPTSTAQRLNFLWAKAVISHGNPLGCQHQLCLN